MKRILRWLTRGLLAIVLVVVVLAGAGLIYREIVKSRAETELVLSGPDAIDEELYVPSAHGEQWLSIRGRDRRNPVILVLHGGPGGGNGPLLTQFAPFEQRYTLVQWDQPGAGKTFRRNGHMLAADLTIEDIVDDGIEVAVFVRERLGVERVIVLGWSWGTVVGVEMARKRPDLVAAYVGTGQVTSIAGNEAAIYDATLADARRLGEPSTVTELEAIGAPPYDSMAEFSAVRMISARLASQPSPVEMVALQLLAPRYSLLDHVSYIRGFLASGDHFMGAALDGQIFAVDLSTTATAFDVPVVFIQGAEDVVTPAALARSYFDRLEAPHKVYVALEGAGHTAPIDNTAAFVAAMDEHVRPLAPAAGGPTR